MATAVSKGNIRLSGPLLITAIVSCVAVAFFSNGIYLLCCLLTFYLILFLTWESNRPGVITLTLITQWMQVVAFVIWMDVSNVDINYLSKHAGTAVLSSCIGLIVIALVISRGIRNLPIYPTDEFHRQAKMINEKKILILYLLSTFFLDSLGLAVSAGGGFAQIIMTISSVKWIFFLMYGYVAWINNKNRLILLVLILFEFGTGLYSYFSTFKDVILITIILALTFIRNVSFKQVVYSVVVAFLLGFILLTWTAVKGDYRKYLNQGTNQQVVEVSRSEAFSKIGQEISDLNWQKYQLAITAFFYRLQYIYHMSLAMDRVPEFMPYENGKVWWGNISYVFMPRLFFPDKPTFDATIKTNKYTGLHFSGFKKGASFSLGYFADGYVDFGYVGMYIPLCLLSLFIVFIYRTFYKLKRLSILVRFAAINVCLYPFFAFEADGLFLFGRLVILFLVFWVLCKTIFPSIQRWLYK
ncbi:MAG: hypothetical protein JST87_15960 [Bacteroidetes bacterium]|nr:hypothetical protein [Bacteroidota bacterium]